MPRLRKCREFKKLTRILDHLRVLAVIEVKIQREEVINKSLKVDMVYRGSKKESARQNKPKPHEEVRTGFNVDSNALEVIQEEFIF